jgi:hypothetical protein
MRNQEQIDGLFIEKSQLTLSGIGDNEVSRSTVVKSTPQKF